MSQQSRSPRGAQAASSTTGPSPGGWLARRWNPYLVGAGIGVLSWITFALMGKALGTSTTIAKSAGLIGSAVAPEHVADSPYYGRYFDAAAGKYMFDWQFFLVLAMFVGALIARKLSRERFVEHVPPLWQWRFGPSRGLRYGAAFVGGVILLFGARMAGGCTSGHGISGSLQLAVSSWAFFLSMFVAGVVTALALFGTKGRDHVLAD